MYLEGWALACLLSVPFQLTACLMDESSPPQTPGTPATTWQHPASVSKTAHAPHQLPCRHLLCWFHRHLLFFLWPSSQHCHNGLLDQYRARWQLSYCPQLCDPCGMYLLLQKVLPATFWQSAHHPESHPSSFLEYRVLGFSVAVYIWDLDTLAEVEGSQVWGQSELYSETLSK